MPELVDFDFPQEERPREPLLHEEAAPDSLLDGVPLATSRSVPPPPQSRSNLWLVGTGAAGIAAAGIVGLVYFAMRERTVEPPMTVNAPPSAVGATPDRARLGGDGANIPLPRLDESDALVRTMASQVTSDPLLARWLATNGLIRNAAVVIANIGEGASPAKHLRALAPGGSFRTTTRNGALYIDPQSYERYTPIARAIASVNSEVASQAYATMRPLVEEAYRDLGFDGAFDQTVERALVRLLDTPLVTDPVAVVPARTGIGYAFADPSLERLSPAQKQLLRFGPENGRRVQEALRNLALALGIPSERLPQPRG